MFLGIEIGGTKLQLGIGPGDGTLSALWRGEVDVAAGAEGIRAQITRALPEVLTRASLAHGDLRGVGIGFGGPTDDATQTVVRSHQVAGWDDFPLADWVSELTNCPAVLGNDADVAGLAEALLGAGKGLSPIFYVTIGSGIGGALILDGEIYRGCGRGAAEVGQCISYSHPNPSHLGSTVEAVASGWGLVNVAERGLAEDSDRPSLLRERSPLTAKHIAWAAAQGDQVALATLQLSQLHLAIALYHVIALLCPRRIVIGGGVSLMGEELLFAPLRRFVSEFVFPPFAGLTDIVPAALGEEVVVHGALALARKRFG